MTGLDADTDAGMLFADVRKERQDERDQQEADQETRDRRERRQRLVLLWTAVGLSVVGVVISITGSRTRSEEVAAAVAPQVAERVVQDARQARVDTGRRELGEANTRLISRDLPVVGDPGDGATGDELVIAAATARVLSILPETTVGRLRDEVRTGRTPPVLPSSTEVSDLPLEDRVIDVIPEPDTGAATPGERTPGRAPGNRGAPPAAPPGRTAPPPRAPAPGPAPAPRRGLLEPCLLGTLLC